MQPEIVTRVPYSVENARVLYEALRAAGIDFVTYLPDSGTFPVQQLMAADPAVTSVLCAREDEGFAIALACKDLGLSVDLARSVGVPVEVSSLVEQLYRRAKALYGDKAGEMTPVKLYEDAIGVQLRTSTGAAPEGA